MIRRGKGDPRDTGEVEAIIQRSFADASPEDQEAFRQFFRELQDMLYGRDTLSEKSIEAALRRLTPDQRRKFCEALGLPWRDFT